MIKKIYIAGPITNNENYEKEFSDAEKKLKELGFAVLNPVKNLGFSYKDYIDMGPCELMKCEAIYLLPGYEKSPGARLELQYALTVGISVHDESSL